MNTVKTAMRPPPPINNNKDPTAKAAAMLTVAACNNSNDNNMITLAEDHLDSESRNTRRRNNSIQNMFIDTIEAITTSYASSSPSSSSSQPCFSTTQNNTRRRHTNQSARSSIIDPSICLQAKKAIASKLMEGYKLKGNGEVCFRCRMPLMLRNQHQQQQEEEESRHDIEEVSGEENNKTNGGEVCVVCNEECVSVRDFERKIVMFSELHCAKLKIDESQENEGDEENGRDETVEQLPQNDINIVTEEDFLTLMDDVKIISDQDGDGIAVDNIETAFRRRCKTCAMDIPINDDIQYDAGGEVTAFAHEIPYGDECQFCHVAKLGYTNDGEESDNEHENALHVDIDDMETVTSDVKSLANIDLGLYKEEMEGLFENEDELDDKVESELFEVPNMMETTVDVEAGDTRLKPPLEVILINDEDKDVCNKKSVKPPWEVILISDKICVAVTKKRMGVKQEKEEEIEIVEALEIELQPDQSSTLSLVEQSQENEEESSTLPVEQSQDKKDDSNDNLALVLSHDKSSFPASLPPRDKSKVVKGLITKFWQQNLEEKQRHKSKPASSDYSRADGIDHELQLEKRDLYEDLLACHVSKQTVHSLQHVFKGQRDPVEAAVEGVEPTRTSQSTRTFMMEPETSTNHGIIDPPCAMDPPTFEETSFMADSTLLNKRQEPNIYCSSVSTLDPPEESKCSSVVTSKDHTTKERTEEGRSLSSHTQHFNLSTSCDEVTRHDAISVLTFPTNPCDVSIRLDDDDEKSTMDEDGIRQQLTQLEELKCSQNKKESTVFKSSPSRKVGYQSSKSALVTISECSTYSTPTSTVSQYNHKSCLDNDSYNNQDQRRRTRLSPAAVARRRHYKEVLMARNNKSLEGIHGSLGPSSVVSYE